MELDIDPARLVPIHEALAQWRMFARSAHQEAQATQRCLSLDLLHAARHLAAGIDALQQVESQHRHHRQILRNLHGAAGNAADRIDRRLEMLRQLSGAAERAVLSAEDQPAPIAARAAAARAEVAGELTRLTEQRARARHAITDVARLLDRHAETERQLAALRTEFTELRSEAERGLELMTRAGRLLAESSHLYEAAQLSATDLRRELLPEPRGPRFETPEPAALMAASA